MSNASPSIVPDEHGETIYLVLDGFSSGHVWRETDADATDLETVIKDLLSGQYNDPQRIIAFNTDEQWSEDVSADVALELRRRCDLQNRDIPSCLQEFTDRHEGRYIKSSHRPTRPTP